MHLYSNFIFANLLFYKELLFIFLASIWVASIYLNGGVYCSIHSTYLMFYSTFHFAENWMASLMTLLINIRQSSCCLLQHSLVNNIFFICNLATFAKSNSSQLFCHLIILPVIVLPFLTLIFFYLFNIIIFWMCLLMWRYCLLILICIRIWKHNILFVFTCKGGKRAYISYMVIMRVSTG